MQPVPSNDLSKNVNIKISAHDTLLE